MGAPTHTEAASGPFSDLEGKFDLVLADPPWKFASNSAAKPGRNAIGHYECMTLDDICSLPVRSIVERDALLILWVTAPFAELAFRVVKAWGFAYKSQLVWTKDRIGTGFWARNRHEPIYIARRGRFPCPRPAPFSDSIISGQQREHSRKPDALHAQIEAAFPEARKLELFAREARPGWQAWGNETHKFNKKE